MAKIFLSYSRHDADISNDLLIAMEEGGHSVWLDQISIRGGELWREKIVDAIDECDYFVIVLSNNSIGSEEVRTELDLAKEAKKIIVPIQIGEISVPARMRYQMAGINNISLQNDIESVTESLLLSLPEIDTVPKSSSEIELDEQYNLLDIHGSKTYEKSNPESIPLRGERIGKRLFYLDRKAIYIIIIIAAILLVISSILTGKIGPLPTPTLTMSATKSVEPKTPTPTIIPSKTYTVTTTITPTSRPSETTTPTNISTLTPTIVEVVQNGAIIYREHYDSTGFMFVGPPQTFNACSYHFLSNRFLVSTSSCNGEDFLGWISAESVELLVDEPFPTKSATLAPTFVKVIQNGANIYREYYDSTGFMFVGPPQTFNACSYHFLSNRYLISTSSCNEEDFLGWISAENVELLLDETVPTSTMTPTATELAKPQYYVTIDDSKAPEDVTVYIDGVWNKKNGTTRLEEGFHTVHVCRWWIEDGNSGCDEICNFQFYLEYDISWILPKKEENVCSSFP